MHKKYGCDICLDQRFTNVNNLRKHYCSMHKVKMRVGNIRFFRYNTEGSFLISECHPDEYAL